jgi:hypothetical protein
MQCNPKLMQSPIYVLATLPKALDTSEKYKPIHASLNVWASAPASLRE